MNKILFCFAICLSLSVVAVLPQDVTTISLVHPTKGHIPLASLLKQNRPKTNKRSPGHSPFLSPLNSRILNKKTPLNVLQNGPYFINHYIYCDNLDQHTLNQIKSGTFSSDKQIQLLNMQKDKFHGFNGLTPSLDSLEHSGFNNFKPNTYTGDKEIHVLHLPNDKSHNIDDLKLQLSLLNAHESHNIPEIDLDLNKNLGSFEVTLGNIMPPKLDSSLLPTPTTSSLSEIVKPLLQGHISGGQNHHKNNLNFDQLTHYLNQNSNGKDELFELPPSGYKTGNKEILDVPHFEQHPLEHDPSKSTYDSPDAVDSYGHPVTVSHDIKHQNTHSYFQNIGTDRPNLANLIPNEYQSLSNGLQNSLKNEDFYQPEHYFNQLNDIHELHRKRRQEMKSSVNEDESAISDGSLSEKKTRHPNHKYD